MISLGILLICLRGAVWLFTLWPWLSTCYLIIRLGRVIIVVLAAVNDGKVALIAGVTKDLTSRFNAGDVVNHVATQIGGKGGGRPDMARAGGSDTSALPAALESVENYIRNLL